MSEDAPKTEQLEFRTEVQQLLHILAHSLYTEREIFLRELISNASDALNRIQFILLTQRDVVDADAELAVHIDWQADARTLTVSDSGVGMTRDELIANLGTIAHSGVSAFLRGLEEGQRPVDIIGQFGVGFYAVFMVAEEVTVTSRSYQAGGDAWEWRSKGDSQYTLAPAQRPNRGTTIAIQLKEDATEFASAWRLEQIVRKHSNYVGFPIYVGEKRANQQSALWRKPVGETSETEYADFYRQLTLDAEPPLLHAHLVTDAPVDIRSILFVTRQRDRGVLRAPGDGGIRLYSRKILIQEHNHDLLPEYLQFVVGVVDSEDIPLNISREMVQSSRVMRQISRVLAARVLKSLGELAVEKPDEYAEFWAQFGVYLKQGVATAMSDHKELMPLLRFHTSQSGDALASLAEYAGRMPSEQSVLYYILGSDRDTAARSPHLDTFGARNLEVLYLLDPLDGFMMQSLQEYEGKHFQDVDDPELDLPVLPAEPPVSGEEGLEQSEFDQLTGRFQRVLGDRVTLVRESKLLTESPCRLVSPERGAAHQLDRVRRLLEQDYQAAARILEVNRRHPLIRNLAEMITARPDEPVIDPIIEQLFDNLLLIEGLHPNPAGMVPRLQTLLEAASTTRAAGEAPRRDQDHVL